MVYFDLKNKKAECPPIACPSVAALGIFDGVHLGHAALISRAVEERDRMRAEGIPAVAVVWSLFENPKFVSSITDLDEKLNIFSSLGIDYAVIEHFDDIKDLSPEEFIDRTLIGKLDCRHAICGFNYRFGFRGAGDSDLLDSRLKSQGADTTVLPPVICGGSIVSSSRIRLLIENGDTEEAAELLGRPFSINFPVVRGKQLGRTIGIPTINQNFPDGHIIPKHGIYSSSVEIDGNTFMGVTNVGSRPTFEREGRVNSETHILCYNGILYGKNVKISFYKRIRDELRFPSADELRAQVAQDIKSTRHYFASRKDFFRPKGEK